LFEIKIKSIEIAKLFLSEPLRDRQPKIKLQNVAHLSAAKSWLPNDHISHAIHHKFTTKTPHQTDRFSETPFKKRSKTTKSTPKLHQKKNLQKRDIK
jgi:hypothetical protein